MVNYYIKYVELVDTVYLALKKKPLSPRFKVLSPFDAQLIVLHVVSQLFCMFITTRLPLCFAILNSTGKLLL